MSLIVELIAGATVVNGLIAGISVDTALVKLPARRCIGTPAYAAFARANDLGRGLVVYPVIAIAAALTALVAAVSAFFGPQPAELRAPLVAAVIATIIHFFGTSRAAPVMLGLKDAALDEAALAERLQRFARWHALRTIFQLLAFIALVWALAAIPLRG